MTGRDGIDDRFARRLLAAAVGILWLVDGLLQFRPEMAMNSLAMVAMGGWDQPAWLLNAVDGVLMAVYRHRLLAPFDLALGLGQAAIGALLLAVGPDARLGRTALWASIVAAAVVWTLGEWMGGLWTFAAGGFSFLFGGPGPVVPYAVAAVLLLPVGRRLGPDLPTALRRAWAGLWLLGALAQAVPALWQRPALADAFSEAQVLTRQAWWTRPIAAASALAGHHPALVNALALAAVLLVGLGALGRRPSLALHLFVIAFLAAVWWLGENFGGLPSGAATDPSSAPAWAALYLPLWWRARAAPRSAVLYSGGTAAAPWRSAGEDVVRARSEEG